MTSDALKELFEKYGVVTSAIVITDRETGRSRGFGFVEMSNEDAKKAISGLHGFDVEGRALSVDQARETRR